MKEKAQVFFEETAAVFGLTIGEYLAQQTEDAEQEPEEKPEQEPEEKPKKAVKKDK